MLRSTLFHGGTHIAGSLADNKVGMEDRVDTAAGRISGEGASDLPHHRAWSSKEIS